MLDVTFERRIYTMKKVLSSLLLASCLFSSSLFAQGEPAAPGRESNLMQTVIMILIAVVFFYFILWRPEQKRRKALEKQRTSMKKGDRITAMGIVGTLDKVQESTIILKMVDGAKIEVLKAAITDVQPGVEEGTKKIEEKP